MNLFLASVSIIAAFVLGSMVGARVMYKFTLRVHKGFERVMQNASERSPVVITYALEMVHTKIVEGASLDEIHQFIHTKLDDLRPAYEDIGHRSIIASTTEPLPEDKP